MAQWGRERGGQEESSNKNWHDQPMLLRHIGNIALKCETSAINNLQIPKKKKERKTTTTTGWGGEKAQQKLNAKLRDDELSWYWCSCCQWWVIWVEIVVRSLDRPLARSAIFCINIWHEICMCWQSLYKWRFSLEDRRSKEDRFMNLLH